MLILNPDQIISGASDAETLPVFDLFGPGDDSSEDASIAAGVPPYADWTNWIDPEPPDSDVSVSTAEISEMSSASFLI